MRSFVMVVAMVVGLAGSAYAAGDDEGASMMENGGWVLNECRASCDSEWALTRDFCTALPGQASADCAADAAEAIARCRIRCRWLFPPGGGENLPVVAGEFPMSMLPSDDLFPQMGALCYKGCWNHSLACFKGCIGDDTETECDDICNDEHLECRAGCDVIFSNGNI